MNLYMRFQRCNCVADGKADALVPGAIELEKAEWRLCSRQGSSQRRAAGKTVQVASMIPDNKRWATNSFPAGYENNHQSLLSPATLRSWTVLAAPLNSKHGHCLDGFMATSVPSFSPRPCKSMPITIARHDSISARYSSHSVLQFSGCGCMNQWSRSVSWQVLAAASGNTAGGHTSTKPPVCAAA